MIIVAVYAAAVGLVMMNLRARWFMEKPSEDPERTVLATVESREVKKGTNQSGRSMMGYSFLVTFRTEGGEILELYTYEIEYGGLKPGMQGKLTYRGPYFVSFDIYE